LGWIVGLAVRYGVNTDVFSTGVDAPTIEGKCGVQHHELHHDLLQELLWTYGPCGQEEAVRDVCRRELAPHGQGDKAMDWMHVYVFTGRTLEELTSAGIGPGTRVCVERSKRSLVEIGDYLGCYFMDDRGPVLALLQSARVLRESSERPLNDAFLVFTTNEEIGGVGGSYASRTLPGDLTIALEVGPTEEEYRTRVSGGPIVGFSDALCVYDKDVADRLMSIATDLGLSPQAAVLGAFESDASNAKAHGLSARAACCACRR
jgi:putative aminopeptidase FrvX